MIRAYVAEDFLGMSVRISIVQQPEGGRPQAILRVLDDDPSSFNRFRWEAIEDAEVEVKPSFGNRLR